MGSSMRRERSSGSNPEEQHQVRQGQKGGACKGERNQEEGAESEDLCVTDAKGRRGKMCHMLRRSQQ